VLIGDAKVGGLAQRMIRGAAWTEAVVVVEGAAALREGLDRVHRALGVGWRPSTLAALEDALPGLEPAEVENAFVAALAARWALTPAPVSAELWSRARALRAEHVL
jgi:lipoate-protein ligase A